MCMSETRQRAHLGAGSRAQAWAIRREPGLVAAERGGGPDSFKIVHFGWKNDSRKRLIPVGGPD